MNILEAATLTGVSRDTIRHYEKLNLINPKRSTNGYRSFTISDCNHIILIKQYNTLGVSLKLLSNVMITKNYTQIIEALNKNILDLKKLQKTIHTKISISQEIADNIQSYTNKDLFIIEEKNETLNLFCREQLSTLDFYSLTKQLTEQGINFRYVYVIDFDAEHHAILVPALLPIDLPNHKQIKRKSIYKTFIKQEKDIYVDTKKLEPHFKKIKQLGYTADGPIILYQILEIISDDVPYDIITAEIPIKK
ncbi:MAG: MerR family transcriptional regulator [Anaerorhabdus sp.]